MQISKINFGTNVFLNTNIREKGQNPVQNSQSQMSFPDVSEAAGRSMVNFKAGKVVLNKLDNGFIENLRNVFNLSNESVREIKGIVTDFLKEYKIKSLSEIGGEDFCNEQAALSTRIREKLDLDEMQNDRLINELGFRCDSKDEYKPENAEAYHNELTSFEDEMNNLFASVADKNFTDVIAKNFRLSEEDNLKMKTIIKDCLGSKNLHFLKDLQYSDSTSEICEIVDKVSKELDFSDYDETLFTSELVNWISSGKKYKPVITNVDRGYNEFNTICRKHNIDFDTRIELFEVLKKNALKHKDLSVFDVFDPSRKDSRKAQEKVLQMTGNNNNFLIDLALYKKDAEKVHLNIQKHKETDDLYKRISTCFAADEINREYDIDVTRDFLAKLEERWPEDVEGGRNKNLNQIAFEIADEYRLPCGAEQKIIGIIKKADSMKREDLDVYFIEFIEKLQNL